MIMPLVSDLGGRLVDGDAQVADAGGQSRPIISTVRSKVMFSSCFPRLPWRRGVNGLGQLGGVGQAFRQGTPQTERLSWYSFQPLPAR